MVARASLRYADTSARKVRYCIDVVRGKPAISALTILKGINRRATGHVRKLLESALANVKEEGSRTGNTISPSELYISKITADEGPTLYRRRAGSMGRVMPIRKRKCHISLELNRIGD